MKNPPIAVTFLLDHLVAGGAERHAILLANLLDRERFRVSMIYLKPDETLRPLIDETRLEELWCANVRLRLDLGAARRIADHLDRQQAQVVVGANLYPTLFGVLARHRAKCSPAVVATYHTTLITHWKDRLQMSLYRRVLPRCEALIYVCEAQRAHWQAQGLHGQSDHVIYNGVDTDYFSPEAGGVQGEEIRRRLGVNADTLVVGLCAALRPEKAHADLLSGCAAARAAGAEVHALIIGDGPQRAAIEAQIAALGLQAHATISGFQSDVRPWIAACNVMTLTSHSETFSLAALECMAMGKPMVMTRVGGAAEQVIDGQTGYLFASGAVDELADCLLKLRDGALRVKLGRRAREVVSAQFALGTMVSRYESVLEACARRAVRG